MTIFDVLGWLAFGALAIGVVWATMRLRQEPEPLLIVCPETGRLVGVRASSIAPHETDPRRIVVDDCGRWPEKQNCDRACRRQLVGLPLANRLSQRVDRWLSGRKCQICGGPVGRIESRLHPPALLGEDHEVLEWNRLDLSDPEACLAHHAPICWNCAVVEGLYHDHPELPVERPAKSVPKSVH